VERVALSNALAWRGGTADSIQRLGARRSTFDPLRAGVSDPGYSNPQKDRCGWPR
jgi:hypothetical protein